MSVTSVYQGLKSAIAYRALPYHSFDDSEATILFASWEQFSPFDHLLNSIPMPDIIKLCIYAERVDGHSDGVAVTVSDEVQHLGYMQSKLYMPERLEAFEYFIASLYRIGIKIIDYDYKDFSISINQIGFMLFEIVRKSEPYYFLPDYARYHMANGKDGLFYLSLYFPGFDR